MMLLPFYATLMLLACFTESLIATPCYAMTSLMPPRFCVSTTSDTDIDIVH